MSKTGRKFLPAIMASLLLNPAQPYAQAPSPPRDSAGIAAAANTPLLRFYEMRSQRQAWTDASWSVASEFLNDAGKEGLEPERYRVAFTRDAMQRDRLRSAAAIAYVSDLRLGRADLRRTDKDILLPESGFDPAAALAAALDDDRLAPFLSGLPPETPEYRQLRLALSRYGAIAGSGGWSRLAAASGDDEIRSRIASEYPSFAGQDAAASLRHFQEQQGLPASGKLDRATLAALNIPASDRARQIAANMERWRWLPRRVEASRIAVNVPAAMLALWVDGRVALSSRVIVGKPATPTPILRADSVGVTVNPPWTIPRSIAVGEMLPKLKRNRAWPKSQNIILLNGPPNDPHGLSVNWQNFSAGNFPYRLQQLPGPDSALGLIKLELPNRFDVYLHDTPGKTAFNATRRALSHGCVRVEQILPLAAQILSQDGRAEAERIAGAIAQGKTLTLPLPRALPVYFLYWTAQADANGEVRFLPDIYGRDRRMYLKLQAPADLRLAAPNVKCPTG